MKFLSLIFILLLAFTLAFTYLFTEEFSQSGSRAPLAGGTSCTMESWNPAIDIQSIDNTDILSFVSNSSQREDRSALEDSLVVINFGSELNHCGLDYAPTISLDGRTLFFVSNRPGSVEDFTGALSHDVWLVDLYRGSQLKPGTPINFLALPEEKLASETIAARQQLRLNTNHNEGTFSIARDGKTVYFTGCDRIDGMGGCDIYAMKIIDGKWGKPYNLGVLINSEFWDSQPAISPNGRRLYFVSNSPKDRHLPHAELNTESTSMNLWYSDFDVEFGEWTAATYAGPVINSDQDDWTPYLVDERTLIFSSNGHPGSLGGFDFYVSRQDEHGEWTAPVNLGAPLNSPANDFCLTLSPGRDLMLFSSTRQDIEGAQGDFDLFLAYKTSSTASRDRRTTDTIPAANNWMQERDNRWELHQNYPNPCSGLTTIGYRLKEASKVQLQLFSGDGVLLITLREAYQEAGEHKVDFDTSQLSTGVYYYSLRTEYMVQSRRMLVLR